MTGPLTAVLTAFEDGARSLDEVSRRCDLPSDVVRASVDHLVRMGRLHTTELVAGCPSGGCGSCASGTVDGGSGCGSPGPSVMRTGPVAVTISVRRPTR